jgi:hypothetical protein
MERSMLFPLVLGMVIGLALGVLMGATWLDWSRGISSGVGLVRVSP